MDENDIPSMLKKFTDAYNCPNGGAGCVTSASMKCAKSQSKVVDFGATEENPRLTCVLVIAGRMHRIVFVSFALTKHAMETQSHSALEMPCHSKAVC